jgi:hypothetical protein
MPSGFTVPYTNRALDHFLKGTAYAQPTNLFIGLATADPGDTGVLASVAEPVGNAYARVNLAGLLGAASGGVKSNTADIVFPQATPGAWGTISHYFITDGTDVIYTGVLGASRAVNANGIFKILATKLTMTSVRSGQNGLTTTYKNKLLDHMFKGTAYTQPANLKLGLTTSDPGVAATLAGVSQPSGLGYARVTINTSFAAAATSVKATNADIVFAAATGSWGTITHLFITDETDVIWMGQLAVSLLVNNTDVFRVLSGQLTVNLART